MSNRTVAKDLLTGLAVTGVVLFAIGLVLWLTYLCYEPGMTRRIRSEQAFRVVVSVGHGLHDYERKYGKMPARLEELDPDFLEFLSEDLEELSRYPEFRGDFSFDYPVDDTVLARSRFYLLKPGRKSERRWYFVLKAPDMRVGRKMVDVAPSDDR